MTPDPYLFVDRLPGRHIHFEGRKCLFFSGTAYLGMGQNKAFQALMAEELSRYGTAFGSSRNGNLRLRVYEEGEAALARWTTAPAALTVSSGMMAGQAVMYALRTVPSTTFLYAPHTHPALWHDPGAALPTGSFADWASGLPDQLTGRFPGPVVIALNALDAVRSEAYAFDWVDQLPADKAITLVVDDSHGIGVRGRGVWADLERRLPTGVGLVVTASLAKAMGLPGGVILADPGRVAAIRQTPFFGGASPMAPAALAAFGRATSLYADAQQRLARNIRLAERLLMPTGLFRQAANYPVFYTPHDRLYEHLLRHDLLIYSFAYPSPQDKPNTRVVISAFHEPADLYRLAEVVNRFVA